MLKEMVETLSKYSEDETSKESSTKLTISSLLTLMGIEIGDDAKDAAQKRADKIAQEMADQIAQKKEDEDD